MDAVARAPDDTRPLIPVACGVLRNGAGEVLMAQRPPGKIAAGYWEFPGGKIEPGEDPLAALDRELHEELGVRIRHARPLIRFTHSYRDRRVSLDTWLIDAFHGEPRAREAQTLAWRRPPQLRELAPQLPTVGPIACALRLPPDYAFTAADFEPGQLPDAPLPAGSLLRLRLPGLPDAGYAAIARAVQPVCRARGWQLMLDRDPQLSQDLGVGWHAPAVVLAAHSQRPLPAGLLMGASAHTLAELRTARRLCADFAVLGPVQPTPSHPGAPTLGWAAFTVLAAQAGMPVYAIGGVGPEQQAAAHAAYAQGTAGIRAYAPALKPQSALRQGGG
ncbi:MAG: Nudix family hydrolase [Gammaproteobacteria bacterium]